jgi:hypothetical protein
MHFFKSVLLLCIIISSVSQVSAQDDPYGKPLLSKKEQRKLAREKKLAEKRAEEEQMLLITKELIKSRRFVLEADYVAGRTGNRQPANSLLNFIIVDSLESTFQLGNNFGIMYNGVGGITVDGTISKYEVSERITKRGTTIYITMILSTAIGNYDIYWWINPSGNAEATLRGTFPGSITYSGKLKSLKNSRVYKGSSI